MDAMKFTMKIYRKLTFLVKCDIQVMDSDKYIDFAVKRHPSVSEKCSIGLKLEEQAGYSYALLFQLRESSSQELLYEVGHYPALKERNYQRRQYKVRYKVSESCLHTFKPLNFLYE
ncbi:hypothetical protein TNCV_205511 [Trichonephila clavipes]|nr:hypothetical protein TNCV_205511 [Trichonephila clavipes]